MPGTQPHTQDGFTQTAAEPRVRKDAGDEGPEHDDPTTLKFEGTVAISDEDAGSDPYNRTGRFRRAVR
ncbi:MAG TPA: hypothetical protein VFL84_14910 [Gammaproteobacteria bacterium]|nr:hypothetical protein [Gammaproteobacteria bacterium]